MSAAVGGFAVASAPGRAKQLQRGRHRAAVVGGDEHQHVVRGGLGVLNDDVEIPVVVEHAGVEQLVLHVELAAARVGGGEIVVWKCRLRILVEALHVGMRRRAVEVEPILLDVLAVVALTVREPEHPLLEDRVRAIPEGERQTQPLTVIADPRDAVLAPAIGARSGVIVREVVPRVAAGAVVLADRAPLPLAQIRAPRLPGCGSRSRLLEAVVLRRLHLCSLASKWPSRHPDRWLAHDGGAISENLCW
jgi:hypothetical protein